MEKSAIWPKTARPLKDCATTAKSLATSPLSALNPVLVIASSATSARDTVTFRVSAPALTQLVTTVESLATCLETVPSPALEVLATAMEALTMETSTGMLVVVALLLVTSVVVPTILPRTARPLVSSAMLADKRVTFLQNALHLLLDLLL